MKSITYTLSISSMILLSYTAIFEYKNPLLWAIAIMMICFTILFYFLTIHYIRKNIRRKTLNSFYSDLYRGAYVLTTTGYIAQVSSIDKHTVTLHPEKFNGQLIRYVPIQQVANRVKSFDAIKLANKHNVRWLHQLQRVEPDLFYAKLLGQKL
jgi:preprotein translocase YajC subunit